MKKSERPTISMLNDQICISDFIYVNDDVDVRNITFLLNGRCLKYVFNR